MANYLLPFHPSLATDDPLGVFDGDELDFTPQAVVLKTLLGKSHAALAEEPAAAPKILLDLLEDIAYTIHGNGSLDASALKRFLEGGTSATAIEQAIGNIVQAAFELECPAAPRELKYLEETHPLVTVSGLWSVPLIAHAALGTLNRPQGNTWGVPGFTSWYASSSRHPAAGDGYLTMMFNLFQQLDSQRRDCSFYLSHTTILPDISTCNEVPDFSIHVVDEVSEPSDVSDGPPPFVLVAANREPGPGPTGTQEERLQAASPWLVLCSLLCPAIPNNAAIITSPLPVLARWTGHNRTAKLSHLYKPDARPMRHYILADALPLDDLDHAESKPADLRPENVQRELEKLYAAFSGALRISKREAYPRCIIEAPPWGCGAFGGNFVIKIKIMMIVAGLIGVTVRLSATTDRLHDIEELRAVIDAKVPVADLWRSLIV